MKVSLEDIEAGLFMRGKTAPVRLNFDRSGACYFEPAFVGECIKEIKQIGFLAGVLDSPSPLQRLAIILIFESAGVEVKAL